LELLKWAQGLYIGAQPKFLHIPHSGLRGANLAPILWPKQGKWAKLFLGPNYKTWAHMRLGPQIGQNALH
jgi:hypothetical protein